MAKPIAIIIMIMCGDDGDNDNNGHNGDFEI